jgi:hypothetical protein
MSACQSDVLRCQQLIVIILVVSALLLVLSVIITYRVARSRRRRAADLEQLVRERTAELKKLVASLQRSQAERSFLLDGMSKRINACLATMKGLSGIAMTYENMPPELVKNIDLTADILADLLQQIAREKKL